MTIVDLFDVGDGTGGNAAYALAEARNGAARRAEQPVDPVFQHNLVEVSPQSVLARRLACLIEEFGLHPFGIGQPEKFKMRVLAFVLFQVGQAISQLLAIPLVMQAFGRDYAQLHFGNHAQHSQ